MKKLLILMLCFCFSAVSVSFAEGSGSGSGEESAGTRNEKKRRANRAARKAARNKVGAAGQEARQEEVFLTFGVDGADGVMAKSKAKARAKAKARRKANREKARRRAAGSSQKYIAEDDDTFGCEGCPDCDATLQMLRELHSNTPGAFDTPDGLCVNTSCKVCPKLRAARSSVTTGDSDVRRY